MQFPEPLGIPDGNSGNITGFLNSFLRGNRDDQPRVGDGSVLQVLNLMNDSFIMTRTSATTPTTGLLPAALKLTNTQLVNTRCSWMSSRGYPTTQEMTIALRQQPGAVRTTRSAEAQNLLLCPLYNKVDFIFNWPEAHNK